MGYIGNAELEQLMRLRRAIEYAALEYASTHPGPYIWIVGKLGLLTLEAEVVAGNTVLEPRWAFIQPTPAELTRAYERAQNREAKRGS